MLGQRHATFGAAKFCHRGLVERRRGRQGGLVGARRRWRRESRRGKERRRLLLGSVTRGFSRLRVGRFLGVDSIGQLIQEIDWTASDSSNIAGTRQIGNRFTNFGFNLLLKVLDGTPRGA